METKNAQCNDERNAKRLPLAGQKQSPESSESPQAAPRDRGCAYAERPGDARRDVDRDVVGNVASNAKPLCRAPTAKNDNESNATDADIAARVTIPGDAHNAGARLHKATGQHRPGNVNVARIDASGNREKRIDANRTARIAAHLRRVAAERMAARPGSSQHKLLSLIAARVWSSAIHAGRTRITPFHF